jgi:hypothetical protein
MTESIDRFIRSANLSQNKGKCLHDDGRIKSLYHLYTLIEQKALIDQNLKDLKKIEPSQCSKEISNISKCFFNVVDRAKLKLIVKNQFFKSYLEHQEQLDPDQQAKVVEFYNNVANGK